MTVVHDITALAPLKEARVTIGNFDGVHIGHRALIDGLQREAGGPLVVITFSPHPAQVLHPDTAQPSICSDRLRAELLHAAGVDVVLLQTFNRDLAALEPRAFIEQFLCGPLRAAVVHVGHDFVFGRKRAGTYEVLRQLSGEFGFRVQQLAAVKFEGATVSSTLIRGAILAGKVRVASRLLGRPHEIRGAVVHGEKRGRTIGFPTANIDVSEGMIPADGIYACRLRVVGASGFSKTHLGAVSVGVRPTFGKLGRTVEAYLFDFDGDLYGKTVDLAFVKRIRSEEKFDSVEALIAAINRDCDAARAIHVAAAAKPSDDYPTARW